jgi:hypothetical protein
MCDVLSPRRMSKFLLSYFLPVCLLLCSGRFLAFAGMMSQPDVVSRELVKEEKISAIGNSGASLNNPTDRSARFSVLLSENENEEELSTFKKRLKGAVFSLGVIFVLTLGFLFILFSFFSPVQEGDPVFEHHRFLRVRILRI